MSGEVPESFDINTRIASGSAGSQPRAACAGMGRFSYTHQTVGGRTSISVANGDGIVMGNRLKLRFVALIFSLAGLSAVSGCGSGRSPEDRQEDRRPKVTAEIRTSSAGYDLGRDEQRGGHTLARHVARTNEELRERLERERNISAASTWTDRATAGVAVGPGLGGGRY